MNTIWRWGRYGLFALPLLFFGLFYVYPVATIFDISFRPDGVLDLSGFVSIATSAYYRDTLVFTVYQATLSTFFTILLVLPGAYVFVHYKFPGRSLLLSLSTLPFVLPTVVVATAFLALVGPRGLLNTALMSWFNLETPPIALQQTLTLILIVHVFYNYSVALRIIVAYWSSISSRIEDAASVLGASNWQLWWKIRLPLLRPAIVAAALLVFIFTFTSFGVVLILGGIRFATLEVQIYYQTVNLLNLPTAAALSLVQIFIMLLAMLYYARLQRQIATNQTVVPIKPKKAKTWRTRLLVGVNLFVMLALLLMPLLALVMRSLWIDGAISFEYYALLGENVRNSILFVPPSHAIANSIAFGLMTTLMAVILGTLLAYIIGDRLLPARVGRFIDPLIMLPLATSAVTLGLGFILALDEPPLNLRTSWVLVPIAHSLVATPFVTRSVLPAMRQIPPSLPEAAQVLGASPLRIWRRIELPLLSRSLVVGATFAFAISLGEFGASVFVARPDTPTMPLIIYRLLGQPGTTNYGQALAMSVILLLVCLASFLLIERFRDVGVGEF